VAQPPPTSDSLLEVLELVTPAAYHEPFVDDPGGAIAQYRGWARALAELAKVGARGFSRQFFTAPPGQESAGFATKATQTLTIDRTSSLDTLLIISTGELTTEGPRERVYRSTAGLIWYPFDPDGSVREAVLECDLIGEPGNLDFLASANSGGLLLDPTTVDPATPTVGSPGTDILDLQDLSQGRSGVRGVLTVVAGSLTTLTDNGGAPTFSPGDAGLYVRFNSAGNPANVGRLMRIVSVVVSPIENPAGSGFYPRTVTLDDGALPALVESAKQDDGGVFTDYTTEGRSSAPNDVVLLPALPVVNDAFYFGSSEQVRQIDIDVTTPRFGTLSIVWEYWNGGWVIALDIDDGTVGFSSEGVGVVSVPPLAGQVQNTVDGVLAYWVRARVDTFSTMTQQPLAGRVVQYTPAPLEVDPLDTAGLGQIGWTIMDWKDLGVVITEMTAPADGRDGELALKLAERQIRRREGEGLDALRRRASRFPDTVTPERIQWEVNRILNPFGLAGQVCDLAKGYSGLFWDVPVQFSPKVVGAWDLYEPGDAFPTDETFLPLSKAETVRHFFVKVPVGTGNFGEFGTSWDEAPAPIWVEEFNGYLGPAWDYAFTDGYAWASAQINKAVWERVNEVRAGGISFELIEANIPTCP